MSDNQEQFTADDLAVLDDKPAADAAPAKTDSAPAPDAKAPTTTDAGRTESNKPTTTPANAWGENWRDEAIKTLALKDEKEVAKAKDWLGKRSSPSEVIRAGLEADRRISEITRDRVKIPTGKDDDPKDVAAFRKALGVPEKPEDYRFDELVPKEYGNLSDMDAELRDEFLKGALDANMTKKQVEHSVKMYWAINQRIEAQKEAQRIQRQQQNMDEIRTKAGPDYRNNVELTNRMFQNDLKELGFGEENSKSLMNLQLADGSHLGDHPVFVQWAFKVARERADDGALVMGESYDGSDLDKKISDMIELQHTDKKEYQRVQPELMRLIAAQNRRKSRGG